jgi:hypothetical protein
MFNAVMNYKTKIKKSIAFDNELLQDVFAKTSNLEYVTLCALAYRQTMAAAKLVWNDRLKMPWYFMKEISSDGDLSTVDVIYPASPLFIYRNPSLLELLLLPIMAYASNETMTPSLNYTLLWAPHHLGYYPIGNIQVAHQENMPMEETGNMLIMLAAIDQRAGLPYAMPHYGPLLAQWANYLTTALPDPGDQLCTDDFEGPSPHNANLAAKGIVAVSAYAEICSRYDNSSCANYYRSLASTFINDWLSMANDGNHYRLQYNLPNTFSLKYNVAIQQVLDLQVAFPLTTVLQQELDYYLSSQLNVYGVPLDDRAAFTKLDWLSWVSTMGTPQQFATLIHCIVRFANETIDRVPLTDWYQTNTPNMKGFRARSVVGGVYLRMCI